VPLHHLLPDDGGMPRLGLGDLLLSSAGDIEAHHSGS